MRKFRKTYIEITNQCNLSCTFCPKTSRPACFMNRELFNNVLEKIKGHSRYLYFHVMGEPLLHPEISLFLDLCEAYDYKVNITTNGTLIRKAGEALLEKPALKQVNFSLHSFEANDPLYPAENYFNSIFEFIRKAQKQKNLYIYLRLWNLSYENLGEEDGRIFYRIAKEFHIDTAGMNGLAAGGRMEVAENVFIHREHAFEWPVYRSKEIEGRAYCLGLREQIAILCDGTVVPCCLDSEGVMNLGNIGCQDMDTILESRRARDLYEGFTRKKAVEELCRKCSFRVRFNCEPRSPSNTPWKS